jgi:hypothetical protein
MGRRYVSSRRRPSLSATPDYGPEERWQHGNRTLVLTEEAGLLAARAVTECALDLWLEANAISAEEHAAGLRLRQDYQCGQVPQRTCRIYDSTHRPPTGTPWLSPAERRSPQAERAYRNWREALRTVGAHASSLLVRICCEDAPLPWSHRTDLCTALKRLQRHYRIAPDR